MVPENRERATTQTTIIDINNIDIMNIDYDTSVSNIKR